MAQSDLRQPGAVLTSHVLDMTKGGPASGVRTTLSKLENGRYSEITETLTNDDGRCSAPLLGEGAEAGYYCLRFQTGQYFGARIPGLFDHVSVDFHIGDATCHYHVPLVAAPWGYSTYLGAPPSRAPRQNAPIFQSVCEPKRSKSRPTAPPPGVGGRGITTHVIDLAQGQGAEGLAIDVRRAAEPKGPPAATDRHETTEEGRTEQWLVEAGKLSPGPYELLFHLGDYYQGTANWAAAPFFTVARVRLEVPEPLTHHHLPLLICPWGYSIYRGS